jgi:hypothetical protein
MFRLEVIGPKATPVPFTLRGRRSVESAGESGRSSRLVRSGGALRVTFDRLNVLFDMTLSGEYQVSVSAEVPKSGADGYSRAASNTLSIRVVQSPTGDCGRWIQDRRGPESHPEATGPAERGNGAAGEWGEEVEGFSLSLETPKRKYLSGEPIPCLVALKNVGPNARRIPRSSVHRTYTLEVLQADGAPAPFTMRGKRLVESVRRDSSSTRIMDPGDTEAVAFDRLNLLLDMTLRGEYRVSVSTKVPRAGASGYAQVTSNTVLIRVVQSATGVSGRWEGGMARIPLESMGLDRAMPPPPPIESSGTPEATPPSPEMDPPAVPMRVPSRPAEGARDERASGPQMPWLVGVLCVLAGIGLGALLAWAIYRSGKLRD